MMTTFMYKITHNVQFISLSRKYYNRKHVASEAINFFENISIGREVLANFLESTNFVLVPWKIYLSVIKINGILI